MKDILKEIISDFYLVTEMARAKGSRDTKPRASRGSKQVATKGDAIVPDGLYAGTGGNYYRDIKKTQYAGRVTGTGADRKWIAVDVEPKRGRGRPSKQAAPQPTPTPTAQPTPKLKTPTPKSEPITDKSLADKIAALAGKKFVDSKLAKELASALKSDDKQAVKTVIQKYKLRIDKHGKLVGPGTGSARKIIGDDNQKLATALDKHLRGNFGLQLPNEYIGVVQSSATTFMPTTMYTGALRLDIQNLQNGVSIDGIEITTTDETTINARINEIVDRVRELRAELDKEFTPEFEQRLREYIKARFEKSNHNVKYLQELTSGKNQLLAYKFVGQDGKDLMAAKLSEAISATDIDNTIKSQILTAVETMRTADRKSFDAAYEQFKNAAEGTPIGDSIKYIAETITAMRTITGGGVAYIPKSASFKLADIVSIGKDPLSGNIEPKQIIIDMDEESLTSAARSVKEGMGSGSGNLEKIKNSEFNTDVDGSSYPDVVEDLTDLCGMRDEIFTSGGKQADIAAQKKLMQYIGKYQQMIVAYYGLEKQLPADEAQQIKYIYNLLSFGKALGCGKDGTVVPDGRADKKGMTPVPFSQATKNANGHQWRAWSVLGKITDAIHNKSVRIQFYDTIRFNGKITVADGIRRFSKMQSQPLKKELGMRNVPTGYTRPDQQLNAFTVPASIEETRNGNPCT